MARRISLLAHNVRSLWNVGSFFRTCDALGIEKLYLTGYTGHPPRIDITKTAIGAEQWIEWEHSRDPLPFINAMKKDGWQIVALELAPKAKDIGLFKPKSKVCLIVGHEITGISEEMLNLCDAVVKIPMLGKKESLNVAVAAGIALHQLRNS
jgi:23S rRNA (guanosine2251-2'-O)-methyltransferase